MTRSRRALVLAPALALSLASLGCAETDGIVEVYWQFVDAELDPIYPQGSRADTCEFPSQSGIRYNLQVRLSVAQNDAACGAGLDDPGCEIVEQRLFPCDRQRGTLISVPVSVRSDGSDPGYLMFVDAVINPTDAEPFVPDESCLVGPGPRTRRVLPGRITDLEIFQYVFLASSDAPIDIDACRPGASGDGDTGTTGGTDTGTGGSTDTGDTGGSTSTDTGTTG